MNFNNDNKKVSWVIFIIWPFSMFLYALTNIFKKNNQRLILAFSFLYGYTVYLYSGDILRYGEAFVEIYNYSWNDYFYLLQHTISSDNNKIVAENVTTTRPDVFALSLQFFVSRFTVNPRWFWAVLSLIYTYLTLQFFNQVYKELHWVKSSFAQKIFMLGLFLIVPFYVGVTGVRFWTALFVFMIFATKYMQKKQRSSLFLAASSILFHYSFVIPTLVLFVVYTFLPKRRKVYQLLVGIALFIGLSTSVPTILNTIKTYTSVLDETSIEEQVGSYTNTDILSERTKKLSATNWYVTSRSKLMLYFLLALGIIDVFGLVKWRESKFLEQSYPLMVLFLVITLITMNLGSIGRFKNIFFLLILSRYIILVGLQPQKLKLKFIAKVFTPILALHVIVSFRAGFYTVDPLLLVNNSIAMFFFHSDFSLSELLIGH